MNKLTSYSQIQQAINKSKNILLCLHPSPDGDSFGSNLAMYWYLESLDKKPTLISGDSQAPQDFKFLAGFGKIINKNITQVNLEKFDLFIGIDSSSLDQITKLKEIKFPSHLKTINIDHHITNTSWANINLVDTNSPAAGQIVYYFLKSLNVAITLDMANNLFVGIYTDSGGFKYPNTNQDTFLAAADLSTISPNFSQIIFNLENNETSGQLFYKALALKNIDLYFDDNLAISSVSQIELIKKNINVADTQRSNISNILKSVIGWNIGASLVETEANVCNLSLRTRDSVKYDVSKLAQSLGGGGHPTAAGAQIKMPLDLAKQELIKATGKLFFN